MKKVLTIILIVGFLSNLFSQTKKKDSVYLNNQNLRLEYNVMKNISLEKNKRYENSKRYKLVEDGIYIDLKDDGTAKYRMTISFEFESDNSNNQYPLEDILDKYLIHVSDDFYGTKPDKRTTRIKREFGGDFKGISTAKKEIIGKKIYNRDNIGTDGKVYVDLIIE